MDKSLRVIDANFNRSREGLRVIEDGIRFCLDSGSPYIERIKDERHRLCMAVAEHFGLGRLREGRDVGGDEGKCFDVRQQASIHDIIARNFMRVQESVRSIEEYSKTLSPEASGVFHGIRFSLYQLEKEVMLCLAGPNLHLPCVYAIVTLRLRKEALELVKKLVKAEPEVLEVRFDNPEAGDLYLLSAARELRALIPGNTKYIIGGRVDICLMCGADGVCLGPDDVGHVEARGLLKDRLLGVSASCPGELENRDLACVDYVIVEGSSQARDVAGFVAGKWGKPIVLPRGIAGRNCRGKFGVSFHAEEYPEPSKMVEELKSEVC